MRRLMLSTGCLLNGGNYAGYIEWGMLLKKFGCEDIMDIYAIVVVPYRGSFKCQFLADLSYRGILTGNINAEFTYDIENAVFINRRSVALHLRKELADSYPERDFEIINMNKYLKSEGE